VTGCEVAGRGWETAGGCVGAVAPPESLGAGAWRGAVVGPGTLAGGAVPGYGSGVAAGAGSGAGAAAPATEEQNGTRHTPRTVPKNARRSLRAVIAAWLPIAAELSIAELSIAELSIAELSIAAVTIRSRRAWRPLVFARPSLDRSTRLPLCQRGRTEGPAGRPSLPAGTHPVYLDAHLLDGHLCSCRSHGSHPSSSGARGAHGRGSTGRFWWQRSPVGLHGAGSMIRFGPHRS